MREKDQKLVSVSICGQDYKGGGGGGMGDEFLGKT